MIGLLPQEMLKTVYPNEVEYRREVSWGVRVVRVLLYGLEPRIMSWCERFTQNGTEKEPMSLGLEEIEVFVQSAREELKL